MLSSDIVLWYVYLVVVEWMVDVVLLKPQGTFTPDSSARLALLPGSACHSACVRQSPQRAVPNVRSRQPTAFKTILNCNPTGFLSSGSLESFPVLGSAHESSPQVASLTRRPIQRWLTLTTAISSTD